MQGLIKQQIKESLEMKQAMLEENADAIARITEAIIASYRKGGKLIVCGCGGSAADSQHIVAELVCKFKLDRPSIPALALTTNTSILTAWGNDIGFDTVFSRQIESMANPGDVVLGISTSGNSPIILNALDAARKRKALTIGFTGRKGGKLKDHADLVLHIPSDNTPRIQEGHITAGHIICELIERELSERKA